MKPIEKEQEEVHALNGPTVKMYLPSGHWVEIRQQNGDDDDILSNPVLARNAHHLNVFVSTIIVNSDFTPTGKLTPKEVMNLKIRDKYAIVFKSRIFSLGATCEFEYDWGKENGGTVTYEDDLTRYLWDYSKLDTFPYDPLDSKYDAQRIKPYISGGAEVVELKLSSGKLVRYEYITGHAEKYLLELEPEKNTKNAELYSRNIEMQDQGKWYKVETFKTFSPKDMMEIRDSVKLNDPNFFPTMDIKNPKTGQEIDFPILAATDFFYPGEI